MCGSSKRHILSLNGCVVLPYFCQSGSLVFHFSALFLSCWSHADAVCTPHTYHTHHTHTHTHTPCTHIHAHRAHTYTHTVHTHSTHGKLHTQLYTHSTHPPTYTHTLCTPTYIYTPNTMHTHSTPLPPPHTHHTLVTYHHSSLLLYTTAHEPAEAVELSVCHLDENGEQKTLFQTQFSYTIDLARHMADILVQSVSDRGIPLQYLLFPPLPTVYAQRKFDCSLTEVFQSTALPEGWTLTGFDTQEDHSTVAGE